MTNMPSRNMSANAPLLWVAAVPVILLTSLVLGAGEWVILGGIVVLGVTLAIFLLGWRGVEDRRGWLLAGGWCVMLLAPALNNVSGLPVGYVLELVVFGLMSASVHGIWDLARRDRTLRLLIILLLLHFAVALLSTVIGRSHPLAALWQLQYNLKWPLMFGLGVLLVWNGRVDNIMRGLIAWSWVFILPALVLEIVQPAIHSEIFGPYTDNAVNPFFGVGTRHRGPFFHAGSLAITSALLAAGASVQLLGGRGRSWGVVALLYFAILLSSGQRQELFALVITLILMAWIHWRRHLYLLIVTAGIVSVLAVTSLAYFEHVPMRATLVQWGFIDSIAPLSERAILTTKGVEVAERFFPLGSGLGTYGGPGAQKNDLSLFIDLGFGRYWWFRQGKFLVDTYWPCIIAESGFFGAVLLMIFFTLMWGTLLRRAWKSAGTPGSSLGLLAVSALTLLLGNTPSSPMLTDPRGAIVFWLIIGAAWRATVPGTREARQAHSPSMPGKTGIKGVGVIGAG